MSIVLGEDLRASERAAATVVLIDDVAELRELVHLGLEADSSIRVVAEAGDGREGIDRVTELQPDAVLTDLSMPGMDGLEAIPLLRSAAPRTAIIVLSGFAAVRLAPQALELGADRYLEKGQPLSAIRAAVLEAIDVRSGGKTKDTA